MSSVIVTLSFESKREKEIFPFSKTELSKFVKVIISEIKESNEWQQSLELVGGATSLAVRVCADKQIRQLQIDYKGLNRATDVLSFCTRDDPNNDGDGYLGDVIISVDTVIRNAKRYKKNSKNEFLRVFIHAILHLAGFEHVGVSAKRRQEMRRIERKVLNSLK